MLSHLPFKLRVKWCPSPFRGLHSDESHSGFSGSLFFLFGSPTQNLHFNKNIRPHHSLWTASTELPSSVGPFLGHLASHGSIGRVRGQERIRPLLNTGTPHFRKEYSAQPISFILCI